MTEFAGMSWATYKANVPLLGKHANAVLDDGDYRKKYRLLAVYEDGTGQVIAQVIRSALGMLVLTRAPIDGDPDNAYRQGRFWFFEPLTDDPAQWFESISRVGGYRFSAEDFIFCITNGQRKIQRVRPGLFTLDRPRPPVPPRTPAELAAIEQYHERMAARKLRLG